MVSLIVGIPSYIGEVALQKSLQPGQYGLVYTHQLPATNPVNQCDKLLRWSVSETYSPHIKSAMKLSCSPLFREINTLCHLIRI